MKVRKSPKRRNPLYESQVVPLPLVYGIIPKFVLSLIRKSFARNSQ